MTSLTSPMAASRFSTSILNSNASGDRDAFKTRDLLAFSVCPEYCKRQRGGVAAPLPTPVKTTDAQVERALRVLIHHGREAFDKHWLVGGPINQKTGNPYGPETKAWAAWREETGMEALTDGEGAIVFDLAHRIESHAEAKCLLGEGATGFVDVELYGVACDVTVDWLHPDRGLVGFMACRSFDTYTGEIERQKILTRLAFSQLAAVAASGSPLPPACHLVMVENREPHRVGVIRFGPEVMANARENVVRMLQSFRFASETGYWSNRFEDVRFYELN